MVVFKRTSRKVQGYAAVFLCENEKGNEVLKEMENPAHNEWKRGNYLNENDEPHIDAKKAEKEINDFINSKLEELSKTKSGKKLAFHGLEEYLAIPEDLLEKDEEYDFEGNKNNTSSGRQSKEIAEEETGTQTTEIHNPVDVKPTIKPKSEVKEEKDVSPDDNGELDITTGEGEGGGDGPIPPTPPGPTDDIEKGSETEEQTETRVLVKVELKVAAQNEDERIFHNLIIHTQNDISNAELELLVGADNDRDDSLEVLSTDNGTVSNNKLKNVSLNSGRNFIKVRFADNLKHTIKIKAYELQ